MINNRDLIEHLTRGLQIALVNWSYEHDHPNSVDDPKWVIQVRSAFVLGRQYLAPELSYDPGSDDWKFAEWERTWGKSTGG